MLTKDLTKIVLMNPVKINYDLYKHSPEKFSKEFSDLKLGDPIPANLFDGDDVDVDDFNIRIGGNIGELNHFGENENLWDGITFPRKHRFNSDVLKDIGQLYVKMRSFLTAPKGKPSDFFASVKKSVMSLEKHNLSEKDLAPAIKALEKSYQKAAIHSLTHDKSIKKIENKLIDAGFVQYQTEESLIKFIKQCKKGLVLNQIEYFERVIPANVMVSFDKAEQLRVFDNYYILYYDPQHKKNEFYEQEKDPIMFGVIKGSNKLYYIDSWIDEHCNLTYKDILNSKGAVNLKLD